MPELSSVQTDTEQSALSYYLELAAWHYRRAKRRARFRMQMRGLALASRLNRWFPEEKA